MKLIGTKTIETERLILRKIRKEDYKEAYKNWCSNKNVAKYVTWDAHENEYVTKELFEAWEKEYESLDTFRWIVELKDTHDLIGTIDVLGKKDFKYDVCEIGYCYKEESWHKGYGTECLKRVIKFLFEEVDFKVITAKYMIDNPNSGKVMEKSGMKQEGILRGRILDKDGKRTDLVYYSITKEEFEDGYNGQ